MKLERLYTLSQFIDYIDEAANELRITPDEFDYIIKYNNFLKQPLTKEMFINPYGHERPINNRGFLESDEKYNERLNQWEEAEKKVIFKGWEITNINNYTWAAINESHTITLYQNYFIIYINDDTSKVAKTLHDLAEATKGELELKNVEI